VRGRIGEAPERVLYAQTIRALIDRLVTDLLEASAERIAVAAPRSAQEVREADAPLIGFSPEVTRSARGLKRFLFENLYHHPQVLRMNRSGERVLKDLFETYRGEPELLPAHVRARFTQDGEVRVIADYVAGMTDRFALAEHAKLSGLHVLA
jgi:dGTPase